MHQSIDGFYATDTYIGNISIAEVPMAVVQSILGTLNARGFVAGIAGGYARDIYYGKKPRDIDVVISCDGCDKLAFELATEISEQLSKAGHSSEIVSAYMQDTCDDSESHNRRLSCVLKASGVDFIFYMEGESVEEITDQFDYNLNQFIMIGDIPEYCGEGVHPDDELVSLREVLPERQAYIETKYKELLKCLAKKQA